MIDLNPIREAVERAIERNEKQWLIETNQIASLLVMKNDFGLFGTMSGTTAVADPMTWDELKRVIEETKMGPFGAEMSFFSSPFLKPPRPW